MVGLPDLLRSFLPCKQSLPYLQAVTNADSFCSRRGVTESDLPRVDNLTGLPGIDV